MSEDLTTESPVVDPREDRFTPVLPNNCRSRREHVMVPRVAAISLPVGIPESALVGMSELTLSADGWVVHVHPNGSLYLHHPEHRTVIEYPKNEAAFDNAVDETTLCMAALWQAFGRLPVQNQPNLEDCELFLRIDPKTQNTLYYFVEYKRRRVFWVQEHSLQRSFAAHAELHSILQFQFWIHVERFPAHRRLPPGAHDELHRILLFQVIDVATNALSTAPYCPSDAALFSKSLEGTRNCNEIDGAVNAFVARLWGVQCRVRSYHLHGAPQVRIERTERRDIINSGPPRWYQVVSIIFLFNGPYNFYKTLLGVFVDEVMYERLWQEFYHDTAGEEWKDHAFMATVTLAANVAFLAMGDGIGRTENMNEDAPVLSPTSQVLSLCSMMLSLGAIVLAKSLPRWQSYSAIELAYWMHSLSKQHSDGLYKLAMLFSLPFALFMWSLALFVIAILSFTLQRWTWGTAIPVLIVAGVVFGILIATLLFLKKQEAGLFIRPADKSSLLSVWGRSRTAVRAVLGQLRVGLLQLAMRCRMCVGKRPEIPGTPGGRLVGDQHALDQLARVQPDAAAHAVEQMV